MTEIIDGVVIRMAGKEYVVPPLSFKALRKLQPQIAMLGNIGTSLSEEQMDAITAVIHTALQRNYPDMTLDMVDDMVDLANAPKAIVAIMGASGMAPSGEAEAGSQ